VILLRTRLDQRQGNAFGRSSLRQGTCSGASGSVEGHRKHRHGTHLVYRHMTNVLALIGELGVIRLLPMEVSARPANVVTSVHSRGDGEYSNAADQWVRR